MVLRLSKPTSVNVLISNTDWAWPQAVTEIFQPRGINALITHSPKDTLNLITNNKIHLAILDNCTVQSPVSSNANTNEIEISGVNTLKMIRNHDKLLPCILLSKKIDNRLLADALALGVFSVMAKPVDLRLLMGQIDRIFTKCYQSDVFSCSEKRFRRALLANLLPKRISAVISWTIKNDERSKN